MKLVIFVVMVFVLIASVGFCQDISQLLGEADKIYTKDEAAGNSVIGGFTLGGIIAGLLFGSIGFIAFMYGKKSAEFRPMLMGLCLMARPYFIHNLIILYLVGIVLTVALFVFR